MRCRSYTYDDYIRAMEMLKKGFKLRAISRELNIPEGTIKGWKYDKKMPPLARWHPEPSKELAYILGVLHGDGNLVVNGYNYIIQLGVKDYEFAEFFSKEMSRLLNKKAIKPNWDESNNRWQVKYYSKAFYIWFKRQNLETLKPFIEHNKLTIANFLRGLYDSEGSHYVCKKRKCSRIDLSNDDLKLLKYVQYLLKKHFNITTRGPYLVVRAGTESKMKNGKIAKRNHDNYQIVIYRRQHTKRFVNEIGFTITEKQLGLPRRR